jgi:hypothetical protein
VTGRTAALSDLLAVLRAHGLELDDTCDREVADRLLRVAVKQRWMRERQEWLAGFDPQPGA